MQGRIHVPVGKGINKGKTPPMQLDTNTYDECVKNNTPPGISVCLAKSMTRKQPTHPTIL